MTPAEQAPAAQSNNPLPDLIPLEDICKSHLNLSYRVAVRMHSLWKLPVPAFRLTASARGPLFVHRSDLDTYVAQMRANAHKQAMQMADVE